MHTLTAREIHKRFKDGSVSAHETVMHFLSRIVDEDKNIGAFLEIYTERAVRQAKALDEKKASGAHLGKLAGVPIAVKDNIHVKGELTTCASKFLSNFSAPFSATVISLIEAEDGIILGKTNMDEFAMGSSTENSALGVTRNPWNTKCVPGGSSGGSAAAVAAGFAPLALGSDTGGSIRQPASLCGLTGFKPTYGRVSRSGLVAFGSSFDQIGPLAANAGDAAMLMEVIGAPCAKDSTSLQKEAEHYLDSIGNPIKGWKVGVPRSLIKELNAPAKALFEQSLEHLVALGCTLVEVDLSILQYSIATYYILATAEASTNLARFDGVRYGLRSKEAKTLDQIYDLSKEEGFGPEVKRRILLGTFVLSAGYQDAYYKKGQKIRTLIIRTFDAIFSECDLVAMPTTQGPAFEAGSIKDPLQMYLEDIFTIAANLAGLPAVSTPAGLLDDMPYGLQLLGPQGSDVSVLQAAHQYEQANPFRRCN